MSRRDLEASRCFNTQPPEGGWYELYQLSKIHRVSTHSHPKAAGNDTQIRKAKPQMFQHTAARRRLGARVFIAFGRLMVSTHSRPKAAGFYAF